MTMPDNDNNPWALGTPGYFRALLMPGLRPFLNAAGYAGPSDILIDPDTSALSIMKGGVEACRFTWDELESGDYVALFKPRVLAAFASPNR